MDNKPGNDTAAAAFQVGDRVRWQGYYALHQANGLHEGIVNTIKSGGWYRMTDEEGNDASVHGRDLTLISRATPAPGTKEPFISKPEHRDTDGNATEAYYRDGTAWSATHCGDCKSVLNADGTCPECPCPECGAHHPPEMDCPLPADSEAAAPAPDATPPALDTHTLELPVMVPHVDCEAYGCRMCGERGYVPWTIRLSDAALDQLAAALAPRLTKHMIHDIRAIANDRP